MAPDQDDHRQAYVDREGLARRLRTIRLEVFGVHGGPEVARHLGLTARAWWKYEAGAPVPAGVLLGFQRLTSANLDWLLDGRGPKFLPRPALETPALFPPPPKHPGLTDSFN